MMVLPPFSSLSQFFHLSFLFHLSHLLLAMVINAPYFFSHFLKLKAVNFLAGNGNQPPSFLFNLS
jgi:hypothetical protein